MHSVYPHERGRLPGCPECDWNCHCNVEAVARGEETICVYLGHPENETSDEPKKIPHSCPDCGSEEAEVDVEYEPGPTEFGQVIVVARVVAAKCAACGLAVDDAVGLSGSFVVDPSAGDRDG